MYISSFNRHGWFNPVEMPVHKGHVDFDCGVRWVAAYAGPGLRHMRNRPRCYGIGGAQHKISAYSGYKSVICHNIEVRSQWYDHGLKEHKGHREKTLCPLLLVRKRVYNLLQPMVTGYKLLAYLLSVACAVESESLEIYVHIVI